MKKPITVVFFIYFLGSGGAGRTFLNILNNIDQDKFRPVLVTCNYEGSYEPFLNKNIKFIKLDTKRLRKCYFSVSENHSKRASGHRFQYDSQLQCNRDFSTNIIVYTCEECHSGSGFPRWRPKNECQT